MVPIKTCGQSNDKGVDWENAIMQNLCVGARHVKPRKPGASKGAHFRYDRATSRVQGKVYAGSESQGEQRHEEHRWGNRADELTDVSSEVQFLPSQRGVCAKGATQDKV